MKITKAEARWLSAVLETEIAKACTFLGRMPQYYARERELLTVLAKVRRVRRLEKYAQRGGR